MDGRRASACQRLPAPATWGGPLAWLVIAGVLLLVHPWAVRELAFVRPAIATGQWWRLVTGNFVHLGFWHLFLDALGLVLWIALCGTRVSISGWCARTLVLALGVGLGLYCFAPHVVGYVGLSGMIYGLFVLDLGHDALVEADRFAALCVVVIAGRVAWAMAGGTPAWEARLMGGQVIPAAHVCGMVTAALYLAGSLLAIAWQQRRTGGKFRFLGKDL